MMQRINLLTFVLGLLTVGAVPQACAQQPITSAQLQKKVSAVTVTQTSFHGWNATVLRNQVAEIIIVPSIGRIMEFNFNDETDQSHSAQNLFWNNPAISPEQKADREGWTNYGGDKVWPAPQSDWPKIAGSAWPPPAAFDSMPYTESVKGDQVEMLSAVDPHYGIRVRRTIALDPQQSVMTVKTTYEKIQGPATSVSIWTITQLSVPERAFILLPARSEFPRGYVNLLQSEPESLKTDHRILSMTRNPKANTMIGSDGDALLWLDENTDLLIENKTAVLPSGKAEWPNHGLHSKIYTNGGDQLKYVELELFTPLALLKPGASMSMACTYTLLRRSEHDSTREAKRVFRLNVD